MTGNPASNPFDNEDGRFLVLVNHERQYSLWPEFIPVPAGWDVAHPEDTRAACVAYIEATWTDMRPKSLADAMNAEAH